MVFELGLLPSGHLLGHSAPGDDDTVENPRLARIRKAFARHAGEGLFLLASDHHSADLPPSLLYWRGFAGQYLSARCLVPETDPVQSDAIEPLDAMDSSALLLAAPPMRGAEYLTASVLAELWTLLDDWVRERCRTHGGLGAFLEKQAPRWHQIGRVCFHLAENKNEPHYPFAFIATYAPEFAAQDGGRIRYQPLGQALREYTGTKNKQALIRLLSPVQRAAEASAVIKELVDTGDIYHPLAWTPTEAYAFLREIPLYEHSGVLVRLPDWWKRRSRPRVGISIGEHKAKTFSADGLLDFNMEIALGEQTLSVAELKQLMAAGDGLALIKGQWVEVNRLRLAEALAHWEKMQTEAVNGLTFAQSMRLLAGAPVDFKNTDQAPQEQEWSFVRPGQWLASLLQELQSPAAVKAADPGNALKAGLRPYQKTGVNWLWLLSQLGLGACLADDMGLGKTMQVIALLLALKKKRTHSPSLLVLPASLLANWKSELERFGPSLRCLYVHTSQLAKREIEALAGQHDALTGVDVVLTTYGTLMRQDWLREYDWQLFVLDEAQAIKNPSARQTRAVKTIRAVSRIALTGTPVENRLSDLWSLFDFLNPGLLGSAPRFKQFIKSLTAREHDQYAPLRNLVRPYILRRLKTDRSVISELPEKTEMPVYCGLSKAQAALYKKSVQELADALENLDGMKRRGLVLAYLMRFKQICNHTSHFLGDGEYKVQNSGKFQRLVELCEEIASRQEKLLVFTQFREMTNPIAAFLAQQFDRTGLVLHGGTPVRQRQKRVEQFQDEAGPPFFVLSLKAGGIGLNLTEASHVIHFDRWWNPAVENQATDRAFRIGQKRNVLVHKLICQGTVEEKIDTLIKDKIALADDVLEAGGETLLTEMDNEELLNLVALDIEKTRIG